MTAPPNLQSAKLLTARQVEILQLVAEELTDRQIATRLHITVNTASTHVKQILRRLGCHTRTGAVVKAFREGVIG